MIDVNQDIRTARAHQEAGRYPKAMEGYRRLLETAVQHRAAGRPQVADDLFRQLMDSQPGYADSLHMIGLVNHYRGNIGTAARLFEEAIRLNGEIADYYVSRCISLIELNEFEQAHEMLLSALRLDPAHDLANDYLLACHAGLNMPGEDYYEILSRFHELLRPERYVEIGVATGKSLALAKPPTQAIGIDLNLATNPEALIHKPNASVKIFAMASNQFFERHDLSAEMGRPAFDMAFIDGLHLFEQVLMDFINLERYAGQQSVILIHDCLPHDPLVADRDRKTGFWTGDVWKIIPCLRAIRPDLAVFTIRSRPSGIAAVARLDPSSRVLRDRFDRIVAEFVTAQLPSSESERNRSLDVVENDWDLILQRLASVHRTAGGLSRPLIPEKGAGPVPSSDRAMEFLKSGQPREAEEIFRQVLSSDPEDYTARNNLGNALYQQGRLDEAEPHYRQAVQILMREEEAPPCPQTGKKIVITHSGVDDVMGSMGAQLLNDGHALYFLPAGYHKDLLPYRIPRDCLEADLFITGDFAFLGQALLARKPVINICWTNPAVEVSHYFGTKSIRRINSILRENSIYLWVMCPFAEMEYRSLGLIHSFYRPLGLTEQVSLGPTYRYACRWTEKGMEGCKEEYRECLEREVESYRRKNSMNGRPHIPIGFLGVPVSLGYAVYNINTPKFRQDLYEMALKTFSLGKENNYRTSRLECMKELGILDHFVGQSHLEEYIEFHRYYALFKSKERIELVKALKRTFGDDFTVFGGDPWRRLGVESAPYVGEREGIHSVTDINIDLNSLSYDTCFTTRCFNTLMAGSFPLQLSAPDHPAVMNGLSERIRFSGENEMVSKVLLYRADPSYREEIKGALVAHMRNTFQWFDPKDNIVDIVLGAKPAT